MSEHTLHPSVQAIRERFIFGDGKPHIPKEELEQSREELIQLTADQREVALRDLVALAITIGEHGAEATAMALAQLLLLAGGILASMESAKEAFQKAGVNIERATELLGTSPSKEPVKGNITSDQSLFNLHLQKLNKKS